MSQKKILTTYLYAYHWTLVASTLIILLVEMLGFSKVISFKKKKFVKENKEYFEIFRNISFQYGIFLINQLFDTHVLKLPLRLAQWYYIKMFTPIYSEDEKFQRTSTWEILLITSTFLF
jgi:hypothetical protein